MEEFFESIKKRAAILKEQYPALNMWSDTYAIIMHQKFEEDHVLIREFINPVDVDKVINILNKEFGEYIKFNFRIRQKDSYFIKMQLIKLREGILDELKKKLDSLGYYVANEYEFNNYEIDMEKTSLDNLSKRFLYTRKFNLQIEPKYDSPINPESFTYHVTPDFNWIKVRTLGLTPKTQSKIAYHPERIYLLNKADMGDIDQFAISLWEHSKNKKIIKNMELLKIDMSKLKNHKFYEDPNMSDDADAIYTYENIPPYAISHIKSILVNPTPEKPGPNPYIK